MTPYSIDREPFVKIVGSGSYLPGESVPMERIDLYLGELSMMHLRKLNDGLNEYALL